MYILNTSRLYYKDIDYFIKTCQKIVNFLKWLNLSLFRDFRNLRYFLGYFLVTYIKNANLVKSLTILISKQKK